MNYLSIQVTAWNWYLQDHQENHQVNSSSFWTLKEPYWPRHLGAGKGFYTPYRLGAIHPNSQPPSQVKNHIIRTGTSRWLYVMWREDCHSASANCFWAWNFQRFWAFKISWKFRYVCVGQTKLTCKTDMTQIKILNQIFFIITSSKFQELRVSRSLDNLQSRSPTQTTSSITSQMRLFLSQVGMKSLSCKAG